MINGDDNSQTRDYSSASGCGMKTRTDAGDIGSARNMRTQQMTPPTDRPSARLDFCSLLFFTPGEAGGVCAQNNPFKPHTRALISRLPARYVTQGLRVGQYACFIEAGNIFLALFIISYFEYQRYYSLSYSIKSNNFMSNKLIQQKSDVH
jgi:hypothetical protein